MNKLFLVATLFLSFVAHTQNMDLFEREWYAAEMKVEGEMIPVPETPADRPEGCVIGMRMYSQNPYTYATADLAVCWLCASHIQDITNTHFTSIDVACLLCMDCGPCNPNYSYPHCSFFSEFKEKQIAFYEGFYPDGVEIAYEIVPLPNGHLQLTVSKDNGDYIIYTTEEVLYTAENDLAQFYIVPNPVSDYLQLNYPDSESVSIKIYNTAGQLFSLAVEQQKINVSSLDSGVYFVVVVTDNGKKAVRKFVKQ